MSFACSLCFGTGLEVITGKGARRCICRRRDRDERLREACQLPPRYLGCTLSNYKPQNGFGGQLRALNYAFRLVDDYPLVERGLLLVGSVGVGKTHLGAAILNGLLEKGVRCVFFEFGALLKEIQSSYSPVSGTTELGVLAPVLSAEVLFLDELGASKPTDWVRDTMLHIIGTRYNDQKLTIFSSNYPDERQSAAEETLEDRIGERLRSRLYEMCRTVIIDGDDYRYRLHLGGSSTRRTVSEGLEADTVLSA